MSECVSIRAFARLVGISPQMVRKYLDKGRLPQNADKTIPLEEGLEAHRAIMANRGRGGQGCKVAPVYARREDGSTVKIENAKTKSKTGKAGGKQAAGAEPAQDRVPLEDVVAHNAERAKEAVNVNAAMSKARLADTTYKARIRELEYKFRAGELLEKTAVEQEAQWLAEQVKSKLLAIPPRISSMCEGRIAREIEEIFTDAINGALAELQKCKYTGGAD
ncbi:MAG: hypothetical protein ACI4RT_02205 [Candidatus Spyradenecus sp.]